MIDFDKFYKDNYNELLRYTKSIVRKEEVAEDIIQDSFINFRESISKIDDDKTHNWIKKVIKNKCMDYYRKSSRSKEILTDYNDLPLNDNIHKHLSTDITTLMELETLDDGDSMMYSKVIKCIEKLPPSYKKVFIMYEIENQSHNSISRKLSISVGASKSNLHRARNRLRNIIDETD